MKFLEKDLEEIIYNADRCKLAEKGLVDYGKFYRQLRIGNYGIADIVSVSRPYYNEHFKKHFKGLITIYELKKDKISVSSFFQALSYLKGIKTYLEYKNKSNLFNFEICLIGNELDLSSSVCYLSDIFDVDVTDVEIYLESVTKVQLLKYDFDIDGLIFNECYDYNLPNKGF